MWKCNYGTGCRSKFKFVEDLYFSIIYDDKSELTELFRTRDTARHMQTVVFSGHIETDGYSEEGNVCRCVN